MEEILHSGHRNGTTSLKLTHPIACSLRKQIHAHIILHLCSVSHKENRKSFVVFKLCDKFVPLAAY
jgi:hypothetical protein